MDLSHKGGIIVQDICINRLDIKGSKENIETFLKEFHSEEKGFSMCCIVPFDLYNNNTWKIINWGTTEDIFECSSYMKLS